MFTLHELKQTRDQLHTKPSDTQNSLYESMSLFLEVRLTFIQLKLNSSFNMTKKCDVQTLLALCALTITLPRWYPFISQQDWSQSKNQCCLVLVLKFIILGSNKDLNLYERASNAIFRTKDPWFIYYFSHACPEWGVFYKPICLTIC